MDFGRLLLAMRLSSTRFPGSSRELQANLEGDFQRENFMEPFITLTKTLSPARSFHDMMPLIWTVATSKSSRTVSKPTLMRRSKAGPSPPSFSLSTLSIPSKSACMQLEMSFLIFESDTPRRTVPEAFQAQSAGQVTHYDCHWRKAAYEKLQEQHCTEEGIV